MLNPLLVYSRLFDDKNGKKSTGLCFHVRPKEKDGYKPHFHIYTSTEDKRSKKYFECCLRFDVPEYWNHESQHGELNSKLKELVIKFLKQKYDDKTTNWEFLRDQWRAAYPQRKIPNKMPDYSKLHTIGEN